MKGLYKVPIAEGAIEEIKSRTDVTTSILPITFSRALPSVFTLPDTSGVGRTTKTEY